MEGYTQETQNISITFVQCWTNVEDVGPTLYKCYANVLCLLGSDSITNIYVREGRGAFVRTWSFANNNIAASSAISNSV